MSLLALQYILPEDNSTAHACLSDIGVKLQDKQANRQTNGPSSGRGDALVLQAKCVQFGWGRSVSPAVSLHC